MLLPYSESDKDYGPQKNIWQKSNLINVHYSCFLRQTKGFSRHRHRFEALILDLERIFDFAI